MSAFTALVQELELDDDELNGLYEQIEERGIELTDDCGLPEVEESTYVNSEVAAMTTDSLQLFLNEAGRYPLLTAAEEVELAKKIERRRQARRRTGWSTRTCASSSRSRRSTRATASRCST